MTLCIYLHLFVITGSQKKSQKLRHEYDGKTKYGCWSSIFSLFRLKENSSLNLQVAGNIVHNEVEEQEEAKFYYGEFGDYTAEINCGGLKIPNDNVCQWTIFCYRLFNEIICKVCRKSLCNVLMLISQS